MKKKNKIEVFITEHSNKFEFMKHSLDLSQLSHFNFISCPLNKAIFSCTVSLPNLQFNEWAILKS
jgi:hypothetical protein